MTRIFPLLILFGLNIWNCEESNSIDDKQNIKSFQLAKEKWESKNIFTYTINLSVNCYCPPYEPIDIRVVEGDIVEIDGKPITQFELENDFWHANTIGTLFLLIEENLAQNPYDSILLFNDTYGYPEEIFFDLEEIVADEEIGYRINSFEQN